MTGTVLRKFGRLAVWFSPNVIVAGGGLLAIWWIKPGAVVAQAMSAAVGIFVLSYTVFLARKESRRWDEVEQASWGFATGNGWASGGFATLVLLMWPPAMNGLVDLVNALVGARDTGTNQLAVRIAFVLGGTMVMVMQTVAIIVASVVWRRRMGGVGEPS